MKKIDVKKEEVTPPSPPPRGEIQEEDRCEEGRSHPPCPPKGGNSGRRKKTYAVSFSVIRILRLIKWIYLIGPME
ncbi:MAG: hypothetical protein ACBR12_07820 [Microcoleus sp.]